MSIVASLVGPVSGLLDKFIEDKDVKNKLSHDLATLAQRHAQELAKSQIEVNKMEAQSRHWFVASWRPFIGWTCGIALMWHFVLSQFILFFATMFGYSLPALPEFDMGSLMTVLMGMLGLGGLRTFEKYKQISK